jgi:lipoprotein-releasing system permease protein
MSISRLLAWRFLRSAQQEKNISLMVKVCFLSIFVGTFSLTLILAIANGFEKATHDKLQGVHSDIIIQAGGRELDYTKMSTIFMQEFASDICAFSPLSNAPALIQNSELNSTTLVDIKGIDPVSEPRVTKLGSMITRSLQPGADWEHLLQGNTLFVGELLAEQLALKIGDTVTVLIQPHEIHGNKITLARHEATVVALFKTGINEYDEHMAFCSLAYFEELFETGITQITAKLTDKTKEKTVIAALKRRFNLDVYSWKDLYPALVSALALEKYAMMLILTLIALIASMNIISLLFMYVTQKQKDIALLKAMGIANATLRYIFILVGMTITLAATVTGIVCAAGADYLLRTYPLLQLPDVYYASHLPSELAWPLVIAIGLLIPVLSFFAMLIPLAKTKHISVTQVLKGD